MSENMPGASKGLLGSLSSLAATLVAIVHTRLDLLSSDLEEEREHFLSLLILALTTLFCFGVGVILATIFLVALFWDTYRLPVLGGLAGLFLLAGIFAWRAVLNKSRNKSRFFAASMSELLKDRQHLVPPP